MQAIVLLPAFALADVAVRPSRPGPATLPPPGAAGARDYGHDRGGRGRSACRTRCAGIARRARRLRDPWRVWLRRCRAGAGPRRTSRRDGAHRVRDSRDRNRATRDRGAPPTGAMRPRSRPSRPRPSPSWHCSLLRSPCSQPIGSITSRSAIWSRALPVLAVGLAGWVGAGAPRRLPAVGLVGAIAIGAVAFVDPGDLVSHTALTTHSRQPVVLRLQDHDVPARHRARCAAPPSGWLWSPGRVEAVSVSSPRSPSQR